MSAARSDDASGRGARHPHHTWRAAALALFTTACAPDELPHFGSLRHESPDFEVWALEELEACEGTYDYMQQWLNEFRNQTGLERRGSRHVFYWITPDELGPDTCPIGRACAYGTSNVIYSTEIPLEHEFVHVELDYWPPSLLREGAAEVFGSIRPPYESTVIDVEQFLDDDQIPGRGYAAAGRLTRYVIDRYGADRFFELYARLDEQTTTEQVSAGMEAELGVDLPTLLDDYRTFSSCTVDRWRYFDLECNVLPPVPWIDESHWALDFDMSCADASVVGPQEDLVWTRRALDVAEAGNYLLTIESDDPTAQVSVFSCDSSCFDGEPYSPKWPATVEYGGESSVFLEAGRHWIQVTRAHDAAALASASVALEAR